MNNAMAADLDLQPSNIIQIETRKRTLLESFRLSAKRVRFLVIQKSVESMIK